MSLRECARKMFEPQEVKDARAIRQLENAFDLERSSTERYMKGEISLEKYKQRMTKLNPITRLDLRKLAGEIGV